MESPGISTLSIHGVHLFKLGVTTLWRQETETEKQRRSSVEPQHNWGISRSVGDMLQACVQPGGFCDPLKQQKKTSLSNLVYSCIPCMFLIYLFLFLRYSPKGDHPSLQSDKEQDWMAEIFSINIPELTRVFCSIQKLRNPYEKTSGFLEGDHAL